MSVLLVRVECLCGTVAAIPEGGFFPLCGRCGRRMVTVPSDDNSHDGRRYRYGMGYAATPMREMDAAKAATARGSGDQERVYSDEDLRASLEARGWPTEDQSADWPQVPRVDMDDGSTHGVVPWETVA